MKVLVLKGGDSSEREISLFSATSVVKALEKAGTKVVEYDTKKGFEGILKFEVDEVFPILHGEEGEDGSIQKFLEDHNLKYLGSDSKVSQLCFDKVAFKNHIKRAGVPTPSWDVVEDGFLNDSAMVDNPFVLKPISGGSSIDAYIVREGADVDMIPKNIFKRYRQMLLEELIIGTEITVAVLDGKALPVVEIIPPENEEFDYENKYNGKTKEICPARSLSEEVQRQAQKLAEEVHRVSGARHLSRIDIMVTPDDDMYVLELNTIPGMTDQSLFPLAARTAGIDMPELMKKFVKLVEG